MEYTHLVADICPECKDPLNVVETEGELVCSACGVVLDSMVCGDAPSAPGYGSKASSYQSILHFRERLALYQCEDTPIPDRDFALIQSAYADWLMEEGRGATDLTKIDVQTILHRIGRTFCNRYYEKWIQIRWRLTGLKPPMFTGEELAFLLQRFTATEHAWHVIRPQGLKPRRNRAGKLPRVRAHMPNFNYMFVKLLEFMGRGDLARYFPQLKSTDRVRLNESFWRDICRYHCWPFVSVIGPRGPEPAFERLQRRDQAVRAWKAAVAASDSPASP